MTAEGEQHRHELFQFTSRRLHLVLLLMLGVFANALLTTNIGITMTCMVNSTAISLSVMEKEHRNESFLAELEEEELHSCRKPMANGSPVNDYGGSLVWSEEIQSYIKGATFLGGLISIFPGGFAADSHSARHILAISVAVMAICNLLLPLAIDFLPIRSAYSAIILRFIMGLAEGYFMPALNAILVRWIPLHEKASAASIFSLGYQLSGMIGVPVAAELCRSQYGWRAVYYLSGVVGFIWVFVWSFTVTNSPKNSKWISEKEKMFLEVELEHVKKSKAKVPIPWMSMLCSPPFLVLVYASFHSNLIITFIQLYIPVFFKDVLLLNVHANGLLSAIPHFSQIFAKLLWSICMDRLKGKHLTPTQAARLSQAVSTTGLTITFLLISQFVNCSTPVFAVILLSCICMSFGFSIAGFITSLISIAPIHMGILSSTTQFVGYIGKYACPHIVQSFKVIGTASEWRSILLVFAAETVICGVTFVLFGSGAVQSWGRAPLPIDNSNQLLLLEEKEEKPKESPMEDEEKNMN